MNSLLKGIIGSFKQLKITNNRATYFMILSVLHNVTADAGLYITANQLGSLQTMLSKPLKKKKKKKYC